jgi:hypothetical protein
MLRPEIFSRAQAASGVTDEGYVGLGLRRL